MRFLAPNSALSITLISALAVASAAACGDDTGQSGGGGQGGATSSSSTTTVSAQTSTGVGGMGGEGGGEVLFAPPLRNPVAMEDSELAYQALLLMGYEAIGATSTTCSECHDINRGVLLSWRDLTDTAVASCFSDTAIETKPAAEAALACLKLEPGIPNSAYSSPKLGIYSAVAHLDWFQFAFNRAYSGEGAQPRADFLSEVAMPKTGTAFTQPEFDIVAEWFARGLPFLDDFLPDDPPPNGCVPSISPDVATHVNAMKLSGWRAVNAENNLLNFGCAGAATTLDCLGTYPEAQSLPFGNGWAHMPGTKLRVLRTNNYNSAYWTRSSADGRFVGNGGGVAGGSTIVDLLEDDEIALDAAYDPAFFPDNSGFMFQGTPFGTGTCTQNLLNTSPAAISFLEPECSGDSNIGLYQHVGATLGGGDYWAVESKFVSDNGGHAVTTQNPNANFGSSVDTTLTPMVFDGSYWVEKAEIDIPTPFEGDAILSPASLLVMSRVAGAGFKQSGFRLRKVVATPNGNGYNVTLPQIGRYCIDGGKPGISYDERWAVLHHYVTGADAVSLGFSGPADPAFAPYLSQGAANLYLIDLVTGLTRRLTHMQPGQYALFPHFRSDGWIYFLVRTAGDVPEHIMASDAALVLEAN